MEYFTEIRICKYCTEKLEICYDEGLECTMCKENVHVRCLKRGSVPGGLYGDLFFTFLCQECSTSQTETFIRNKMSWLQVINLALYHLQTKCPGLARRGFFHWKHQVASFIDKHWDIIFSSEVKKKKKWTGTVAGTLSHFSSFLFLSGTQIFQEPAWWTLTYPKLSPSVISNLYGLLTVEKQKAKLRNERKMLSDGELFQEIVHKCIKNEELLESFNFAKVQNEEKDEPVRNVEKKKFTATAKNGSGNKRKSVLPTLESTSRKIMKLGSDSSLMDDLTSNFNIADLQDRTTVPVVKKEPKKVKDVPKVKLLDPFCYFNTSLNNISRMKGCTMQMKVMGGLRKELILSPYSGIYLKPYIRRDMETYPAWLRMMAELQTTANKSNSDFILPPRAPIDYTYVQPEHIPAINSLCNQFFWPGIDLTDSLQYPDFSCVAMYKKLIIAFAFLVPDVKHTENYISFIFTRPGWRKCGVAKFMLYHLIQTGISKDITLHVSINSPALFLYQKFGFKVEQIVLNFYDKYFRNDVKESKHAFFCRLER